MQAKGGVASCTTAYAARTTPMQTGQGNPAVAHALVVQLVYAGLGRAEKTFHLGYDKRTRATRAVGCCRGSVCRSRSTIKEVSARWRGHSNCTSCATRTSAAGTVGNDDTKVDHWMQVFFLEPTGSTRRFSLKKPPNPLQTSNRKIKGVN
jgi:hypothetical protein